MDNNGTTLQALLRFAMPWGAVLVTGTPETKITWAVTVRAQPPAFPEVYGGELALVSMNVLRSYDRRITLENVVESLANVGVHAIAAEGKIPEGAVVVARAHDVSLLALPEATNLTRIERAVTTLIVNQAAQLNQRAIEVQRQLTRQAAENRSLDSLLQIMARATAKPLVVHDDAGVLMAQMYPNMARGGAGGRALLQSLPYNAFQRWLDRETLAIPGAIVPSPLGHTTALKVENRVAGYLSLVDRDGALDEFDRLVLTYGADVCAIELAKSRAIAVAVEQTRGDWVQMWLSGSPADDSSMMLRAQQVGFDASLTYVVVVFRAITAAGVPLPVESLVALVRDDMTSRAVQGAIGRYVDVIVALYPLEDPGQIRRVSRMVEEVRSQLAARTPSGIVSAGISRPAGGLVALRERYREAKDAVNISAELGERAGTTFYGDLKLYQLLLALKEHGLNYLREFCDETLGGIVEHDARRQGDLLRTLEEFFEANGNLAKAAAGLDVHRNTLVYRLERIRELTELDLDVADNRLLVHLALKIRRVLATVPE